MSFGKADFRDAGLGEKIPKHEHLDLGLMVGLALILGMAVGTVSGAYIATSNHRLD